jgi:hypothetical protein
MGAASAAAASSVCGVKEGDTPAGFVMALPQLPQKRATDLLTNPHDGQFTGRSAERN